MNFPAGFASGFSGFSPAAVLQQFRPNFSGGTSGQNNVSKTENS